MPRIYLPPEKFFDKSVLIDGEQFHHLHRVLRLQKGEPIWVIDGKGQEYWVKISEVQSKEMRGEILGVRLIKREPPVAVTLYQGLLRPEKMDLVIEKATEIGVTRIIPLITSRTQIREISPERKERWEKIIKAACQQCQRTFFPAVEYPVDFNAAIDRALQQGESWLFWEDEENDDPLSVLNPHHKIQKISVFIGSEGGFTLNEVSQAREKKVKILSLGNQILRSETAAIAALQLTIFLLSHADRFHLREDHETGKFM